MEPVHYICVGILRLVGTVWNRCTTSGFAALRCGATGVGRLRVGRLW